MVVIAGLAGLLTTACSVLTESETVEPTWTPVEIGLSGEVFVVNASPWSVTAVLNFSVVYDSEDGSRWNLLKTPDILIEWAGRTADHFVVVDDTSIVHLSEGEGPWIECALPGDGEIIVEDGLVTEDGLVLVGADDAGDQVWIAPSADPCAWQMHELARPNEEPSPSADARIWKEIDTIAGEIVVVPAAYNGNRDRRFYWRVDAATGDVALEFGSRPIGLIDLADVGTAIPVRPVMLLEVPAGAERVELPMTTDDSNHMVARGLTVGESEVVVGSVFGMEAEPGDVEQVVAWTRRGDDTTVAVAAELPGFGVSVHDLVVFDDTLVMGGSYVAWERDGRSPFLLTRSLTTN